MKIRNFLLITALACSTSLIYAAYDRGDTSDGGGGIAGNTATGAVPNSLSLASSISLVNNASLNVILTPSTGVYISSMSDQGTVSIVISNSSQMPVYTHLLNTATTAQHYIDITNLPEDTYTLAVVNNSGITLSRIQLSAY